MQKIETMKFKNPTKHTLKLDSLGLDPVPPGGEIDVPLYLCAAGRGDGGGRKPSSLECVAPQLVPVTEDEHEEWKKVPPPPVPVSKIVSITKNAAPQEPAGVKALRETLAAKKAAEAAPKAVTAPPANDKTPEAPKAGE